MARYALAATVLAVTGLAAGAAMSQIGPQVEAAKKRREVATPSPAPAPPRQRRPQPTMEDRAARALARVRDCRALARFPREFQLPSLAGRIAEKRRALRCDALRPDPVPVPPVSPPSPPPQPSASPRAPVDGIVSGASGSPVEFMIGRNRIRLAGVIGCNPANDRSQLNRRLSSVLICRPLGADYQCFTRDTNEDVASIAVLNGNAQPTGEAYENEFYSWRARVVKEGKGAVCLSGR